MSDKIKLGKILVPHPDDFGEYEWEKETRLEINNQEAQAVLKKLDKSITITEAHIQIEEDMKNEVRRQVSRKEWAKIIRNVGIDLADQQ